MQTGTTAKPIVAMIIMILWISYANQKTESKDRCNIAFAILSYTRRRMSFHEKNLWRHWLHCENWQTCPRIGLKKRLKLKLLGYADKNRAPPAGESLDALARDLFFRENCNVCECKSDNYQEVIRNLMIYLFNFDISQRIRLLHGNSEAYIQEKYPLLWKKK